eukprot:CAMPEP_0194548688 /NCGR_PEP_ID=MMETSP0253-20130528/94007_1 /TAXON_ID=2966 /ORGANISM="Noctiluca scintillans" /LENGTH=146 /DNA_ID=CAMNT_0039396021 /DNA_START=6 /DNA_END=446 /DNA_ORIENTATION=+
MALECGVFVPSLCNDAAICIINFWWPQVLGSWWRSVAAMLSPRTLKQWRAASASQQQSFEQKLRKAGPMVQAIAKMAQVSPTWRSHVESYGWAAVSQYLYAKPGSSSDLRKWYDCSMRELLTRDWLSRRLVMAPAPHLVDRILAFV